MHHGQKNDTAAEDSGTCVDLARLVELCAKQVLAALDEAYGDIDALSRSVLDSGRHAHALLSQVSDQNLAVSAAKEPILTDSQALQQAVQNAGTRLQFADRLNQRLSNVSRNLVGLAELLRSTDLPITDTQWIALLSNSRATFTMEQERQMFDTVFEISWMIDGTDAAPDASPDEFLFEGDARHDR